MTKTRQNTPKERLDRFLVLVKRARTYARSTIAVAAFLGIGALILALTAKRVYRSETTVVYRDAVRTGKENESPTQRAARLGPRLKEYVYLRSRLQTAIERFDLYPNLVQRSMLDALDEMQKNVSFRTRSPDTFVIAFSHETPQIAQDVTAHLAATMIADYSSDNLDSALTTHDVLRSEVESAQKNVEETSRALARFLAQHPQFTWGLGDSPYASGQQIGSLGPPSRAAKDKPPLDGVLSELLMRLRTIDAELAGIDASTVPVAPLATDAQKQRDAAAAALATAEADLTQKLSRVTKVHPDAISAQARVDRARAALASAEGNLTQALTGSAPAPSNSGLDPARQTELETERKSVLAQISARRAGIKRPETPAATPSAARVEAPDVVELETEWHKLRLDLERARDAFRKAEDKERTARLQATSAEREVQESLIISDPAYLPVHPESGRGRVFLAGAVVAIFLALGYAGARVLLCDTIFDAGDLQALDGPPHLVSIPHIPNESQWLDQTKSHHFDHSRPLRDDQPLVRRDERHSETNTTKVEDIGEKKNESSDEPHVDALAAPISLPATALHTYVEHGMENLVIVGAPFAAGTRAFDEVARHSPTSILGALRVLRHRLEQRRGEESLVVSIQSPLPNEGKTTITTRLALTLAEADRARVILVEGNLARPKLAQTLGLQLPEDLSLTMQIRRRMSGQTGAWSVVRLGASVYALVESAELGIFPAAIHSLWFPALIRELKAAYDYVVIDGCAVLDAGDANVLEEVSDAVVLVVRAGLTNGTMVTTSVQQLGERRIFGLVLNDEPTRPA